MKKIIILSVAAFISLYAAACNAKNENQNAAALLALVPQSSASSDPVTASVSVALADDTSATEGRISSAFDCNGGLTLNGEAVTPIDFRFYVSNVKLIKDDASETLVDVTLTQNDYQYGSTALMDFENLTGTCTGGDAGTNTTLSFTVPAGTYKGIQFDMGVEEAFNSMYNAKGTETLPSPMDRSTMYWSWTGGYKFTKVEFTHNASAVKTSYHPGATNCSTYVEGTSTAGAQNCQQQNRAVIRLTKTGFDPEDFQIVLNMSKMFKNYNPADSTNGGSCMPAYSKTECVKILNNLGLTYSSTAPDATVTATAAANSFELR